MMNTTKTTEVTLKELVSAFKGQYANISPSDHYGISIDMQYATLELEENERKELYFVTRDIKNRVITSICIDEDSIENIEKCGDTYTVHFSFCMTSVDIVKVEIDDLIDEEDLVIEPSSELKLIIEE